MGKVLTKQYKGWVPGVVITNDVEEWQVARKAMKSDRRLAGKSEPGETAYVNAERMQQLEREGYFDA